MCTWNRNVVGIVTAVGLLASQAYGDTGSSADDLFAAGKKLVERNVGDSHGATKEALLNGIAQLEDAIRMKCSSPARAYDLIARAYGTLWSRFARPGSPELKEYWKKEVEALENVMRLDPRDAEARLNYAETVEDPGKALKAYDEILAIQPRRGDVLYASGETLIRLGRVRAGLDRIEKAAEVLTPYEAKHAGAEVVRVLREYDRDAQADKWEAILEERAKKSEE
jgi:tetratricopeptide (TPR) repeat protein